MTAEEFYNHKEMGFEEDSDHLLICYTADDLIKFAEEYAISQSKELEELRKSVYIKENLAESLNKANDEIKELREENRKLKEDLLNEMQRGKRKVWF